MKIFKILFLIALVTIPVLQSIIARTKQPTRYHKLSINQKRKPTRDGKPERKLMLGAMAGGAVGAMAASALLGPSDEDKRKAKRYEQDLVREKQQYTLTITKRGSIITEIEQIIILCEDKLGELSNQAVSRIYELNSLVESANMKQIRAIKKFTASVENHIDDYEYADEDEKKKE